MDAPPFHLDCSHQANNEGTPAAGTTMPQPANMTLSLVNIVRSAAAQGMIIDSIHPSLLRQHSAAAQELVWPPRCSSSSTTSDLLGQAIQIMDNINAFVPLAGDHQCGDNQQTIRANRSSSRHNTNDSPPQQ